MTRMKRVRMVSLLALACAGAVAAQTSGVAAQGNAPTRAPPLNLWSPQNTSGGIAMGDSGCGAEQLQSMLGHPVDLAEALPGLMNVRVFTPDAPVGTMDFIPSRLNILAGESGLIEQVSCG